jgi:ppGpp synthetase/RelA/SpoT-type nucleotidyltranferase
MVDAAAFETIYTGLQDLLRTAERDVSGLVAQAISQIGNPFLVRSTVDSTRVKALRSVLKKCERKGLRPDEIIGLSDLVGIRVVCANLEDVERLVELVKGIPGIEITAIQKKKTADGYRAVHVDMRYRVEADGSTVLIPCELQIRTFLQDSWAKQTHQDLYKGGRVPGRVKKLSKSLARMLDVADEIAQQIREEVSQRRPRRGALPETVTERGLGLIYQRNFGEPAPDYLLQIARRRCEEEGIDRLDALDRLLADRSTRQRLVKAYTQAASFHVDGYEAYVAFEYAPVALSRSVDAAVALIQKRAVADDTEIDGIYRSEALSDLPDSFDEFMDLFTIQDKDDDPSEYMDRYASAFGATSHCSHCYGSKLSEYDFAGEVQKYYGVKNREDEILQAIWNSGADTCRHCGAS